MRIVFWCLGITAALFVVGGPFVHAEVTPAGMVPKAQLDALQKRFDKLEDHLRTSPQCLRLWTNHRPAELSL